MTHSKTLDRVGNEVIELSDEDFNEQVAKLIMLFAESIHDQFPDHIVNVEAVMTAKCALMDDILKACPPEWQEEMLQTWMERAGMVGTNLQIDKEKMN